MEKLTRNFKHYLDDISERLQSGEESEAVELELTKVQKQAHAVRKFCSKFATAGATAISTLETYEQQVQWCMQEPVVDSPFPPYVQKIMHSLNCSNAWPPQSFWQLMAADALEPFIDKNEILSFQSSMTGTKITVLTQEMSCI